MVKKIILAVSFLVLLVPFAVSAEIREGSFEVSPFAGRYFFGGGQNLLERNVYGLRLGYNITKTCGLELSLEQINSRIKDKSMTSTGKPPFVSPDDGVKNTLYHIDAVYHFQPESRFNPFLVAGLGGAGFNPSSTGNINRFLADFGVGAKYRLSDTTALRADLRDIITFDSTYHNIEATLGLVFTFGGRSKPAPKIEPKAEVRPEPKIESKPAPAVETKAEPVQKVEEKTIVLEDIHFDYDKAVLTNEAKMTLKRDIQVLRENPAIRVRIEGHACAHGTEAYNQRLSERRVNAVKEFIATEGGVAADRLSAIAYGETRLDMPEIPTPKNKNSKEAKANRRVHFVIIAR